jgi:hypothetical protein
MIDSVYILVKPANVTTRMVNLSTSHSLTNCSVLPDNRVVLEFEGGAKQEVLDHVWYTAEEIANIRQDLESQGSQSRWWWPF